MTVVNNVAKNADHDHFPNEVALEVTEHSVHDDVPHDATPPPIQFDLTGTCSEVRDTAKDTDHVYQVCA
jgi:hypothetical protein